MAGIWDMLFGSSQSAIPETSMALIPEADRQKVLDQSRSNYWTGFLASPHGGLLNRLGSATLAEQNTVADYLRNQAMSAQVAEAQRKAANQALTQSALLGAVEVAPGTGVGTADEKYLPRDINGQIVAGPGYIPPQQTVNPEKFAMDPRAWVATGGDASKLKELMSLSAPARTRALMNQVPSAPATAMGSDPERLAMRKRIEVLNTNGFFEEADKLSQQYTRLYPDETFGSDLRYLSKGGKTMPVLVGNRGNIKELPGYGTSLTPNEAAQLNKGEIKETENGYVVVNPRTGQAIPVVGKDGAPIEGKGASLTEDQGKSTGFYSRMRAANSTLGGDVVDKQGTSRGKLETLAGKPELFSAGANVLTSEDRQRYLQAKNDWILANLRAESGAAIGAEEYKKQDETYFPQIGDSEATVRQKAEARKRAEQAMRIRSGKGAKQIDGDLLNRYQLEK